MKSNASFKAKAMDPDVNLYAIDVAKIRQGDIRLTLRHADYSGKTAKHRDFRIEMSAAQAAQLAATVVKNLI